VTAKDHSTSDRPQKSKEHNIATPDASNTKASEHSAATPLEDEAPMLERARTHWQLGEWSALASLADRPLEQHSDRAKLALLAAVALAQTGDTLGSRRLARQAQDWDCDRRLFAQVLIGGVYNSLARAASLLGDEACATDHFESSIALVNPRASIDTLARARNINEKVRLGQLPSAAHLIQQEFAELQERRVLSKTQVEIFKAQIEMMNQELGLMQKRAQLDVTGDTTQLENRAASQLGQDLWVLERTGQKRGGFFVEFGATDGIRFSNTWMLERDFGWLGICAEPNPQYFVRLCENRRCTVAPDCILGETGRKVEFILADEFGAVSDFACADVHAGRRLAYRAEGHWLILESISLNDFLEKYSAPRHIDYLSIDTEGSEYDILSRFPFDRWDVQLVTVEHNFTPDRERIRELMSRNGYQVIGQKWDDWFFKGDVG
jgi:FkbM family methyltransferase